MLRFRKDIQSTPPGQTPLSQISGGLRPVSRRERLRLWLLVFALGLVLLTMRRMATPQVQQNLQRWLHLESTGKQRAESGEWKTASGTSPGVPAPLHLTTAAGPSTAGSILESSTAQEHPSHHNPETGSTSLDELLQNIKDNTSFRPQEHGAWFALLTRLRQSTPSTLSQQSLGALSYAQLLQQPDVYRGKIVTISGTALREECLRAPENSVGIGDYHRLILKPTGGGEWPFVIYSLKLPENFPRGDHLRAPVQATGYFFKNWSYSWGNGFGLAPVVLVNHIHWTQPIKPGHAHKMSDQRLLSNWKYLLAAIGAATLFALLMWKVVETQTGHAPHRNTGSSTPESEKQIQDHLRQLSEQ